MSIWASLDTSSRYLAPKLLAVSLVVLGFVPLHIPVISHFIPLVDIIVIYYWTIYRPDMMPHWFVFLLGVLQDIFLGFPIGISAFINLIFWMVLITQRRLFMKEPFVIIWVVFLVFSFGVALLKWAVMMVFMQEFVVPDIVALQWLLTVALYPLIHGISNILYTLLPDQPYGNA
ncbi:MAG: mreD [Rickettsiales bacterium]|jgi:rod shape-determining protein MreD|nr:mreD [Rickettsiales bacterium]